MYGKKANHVHYIKQATKDRFIYGVEISKGNAKLNIEDIFARPSYWSTFRYDRLAYMIGLFIGLAILLITIK